MLGPGTWAAPRQVSGMQLDLPSHTSGVIPNRAAPFCAQRHGVSRQRGGSLGGGIQRGGRTLCTASASSSSSVLRSVSVTNLPRIEFSTNWTQINISHLEELLDRAHGTSGGSYGVQDGLHGSEDEESRRERRLQLAKVLSNSMVVVAAYTRASNLPGFDEEGGSQGSRGAEEDDWKRVAEQRRRSREKRLVGFVRVSGDGTLVSTLYDVAVLPELQGLGLGRKLMLRACQGVFGMGIGDVAAMVPPGQEPFFQACSFGPDQVCESLPMAIPPGSRVLSDDDLPPSVYLRKETLEELLLKNLERRR